MLSPTTIKQIRLSLNLTQAQLAERMGVTRGQVSKWECTHGRYKMSRTAEKLLAALSPPAG